MNACMHNYYSKHAHSARLWHVNATLPHRVGRPRDFWQLLCTCAVPCPSTCNTRDNNKGTQASIDNMLLEAYKLVEASAIANCPMGMPFPTRCLNVQAIANHELQKNTKYA
jgi:hypothetical protein